MTVFYAATASDGSRERRASREAIDSWAAMKCAAGCDVDVWAKTRRISGTGVPEFVGRWEPLVIGS